MSSVTKLLSNILLGKRGCLTDDYVLVAGELRHIHPTNSNINVPHNSTRILCKTSQAKIIQVNMCEELATAGRKAQGQFRCYLRPTPSDDKIIKQNTLTRSSIKGRGHNI